MEEFMREYYCDCCESLLTEREIREIYDERSGELYLVCRQCGSECREWYDADDDNEGEDEEEN